jgi:NADPH-dependent ferric siderophore reductase
VTEPESRPLRRRRPPQPVEVVSACRITPRMVSVVVAGDSLDGFASAAPTSHMKLLFPPGGGELVLPVQGPDGPSYPEGAPRPVMRTYTPRRFDPAAGTLEIQFVLHGEGPASQWAQRAAPGDKAAVAGPGGRFVLDETVPHWWIAADESAIPAVGTLLEALPASAFAEVHIEVAGAADEFDIAGGDVAAKVAVTWRRRRSPGAFGAELGEAARAAELPGGARVWVACEAGAMRGIRRYFIRERGLGPGSLVTRGYWRLGAANHPDHDYGED